MYIVRPALTIRTGSYFVDLFYWNSLANYRRRAYKYIIDNIYLLKWIDRKTHIYMKIALYIFYNRQPINTHTHTCALYSVRLNCKYLIV